MWPFSNWLVSLATEVFPQEKNIGKIILKSETSGLALWAGTRYFQAHLRCDTAPNPKDCSMGTRPRLQHTIESNFCWHFVGDHTSSPMPWLPGREANCWSLCCCFVRFAVTKDEHSCWRKMLLVGEQCFTTWNVSLGRCLWPFDLKFWAERTFSEKGNAGVLMLCNKLFFV